jgi:hypothetical protein
MERGMLITCPAYDDATAYLKHYSKAVIIEAENKSLKIKSIEDKELNLETFSEILKKIAYRLVVINGHGSNDTIFGYKNQIMISQGKNDYLLKERIVYARSCDAGQTLGPESMQGTKEGCFIGYRLPFIFYMDAQWTTKPNNDQIAKMFLEPSNLVPIYLIKGHQAIDAHERSKEQILRNMKKILAAPKDDESSLYIEALWNNYSGQVIYGKKEAKL